MREPDLKELKEEVLNEVVYEKELEPAKVKLFKVVGYKTFDAMKNNYNVFDGQKEIEKQINDFLSTIDAYDLDNVNVQVVKNFYPHTQNGEYEEIWYGTVVYRDEE